LVSRRDEDSSVKLSCDCLLLLSCRAFNFRISEDGIDLWLKGLSMLNCFDYLAEVGLHGECGQIFIEVHHRLSIPLSMFCSSLLCDVLLTSMPNFNKCRIGRHPLHSLTLIEIFELNFLL